MSIYHFNNCILFLLLPIVFSTLPANELQQELDKVPIYQFPKNPGQVLDYAKIKRILQSKPNLIHSHSKMGYKPIHTAAMLNDDKLLRILIEHGGNVDE